MIRKFFSLLNTFRKIIINLVFFTILLIFMLGLLFSSEEQIAVPENSALVLNLNGDIVEQKQHIAPVDAFFSELSNDNDHSQEILLADVVKVIKHARNDDNVKAIVLKLSKMNRSGLTKMRAIAKALLEFKSSGKKIIAAGDHFTQEQYFLASFANEIWLNPNGWLLLDGYGRYQMYFRSAFEKLDISQHVFRVGTYKSAVEPYLRDNMSDDAKKANKVWLNDLWTLYKNDVAKQRGFSTTNFDEDADILLKKLKAADGKIAQYALNNNWVDSLKTREQMTKAIIDIVGKNNEEGFNHVVFDDYLAAITPPFPIEDPNKDKVGIIVAKGTILDGKQPAGTIGGDSTAALLRKARKDNNVKAVVLRVDSPGGSAFASEVIRQEVELLKAAGKPVIASMGTYAASGGYWISASANKIYASPSTITGSIGIFGFFMTFENTLSKLGIHTDGVGTTELAGLGVTRALPSKMGDIFQIAIDRGYKDFINLVAENRKMTYAQADAVAQGRVWSGARAKSLGLVDEIGDLNDAVIAAANMAGLENYQTKLIEKELSPRDKLLKQMLGDVASIMPEMQYSSPSAINNLINQVKAEFSTLEQLNDPQGIYAMCLPCQPL